MGNLTPVKNLTPVGNKWWVLNNDFLAPLLGLVSPSSLLDVWEQVNLWNFGLCLQAPYTSLDELIILWVFKILSNLLAFRFSNLSLIQTVQFNLPNVFILEIGLPCHSTLTFISFLIWAILTCPFFFFPFSSSLPKWLVKCFAKVCEEAPLLIKLLVSTKWPCILFFTWFWVLPM